MIELIDVGKVYHASAGDHRALEGVNLRIEDGDIFGIIGESGAGKSTLVRLLNLLERPTEGRIIIDPCSSSARCCKMSRSLSRCVAGRRRPTPNAHMSSCAS